MQYWLRRNNIDKGPFTKEALLSQGLTPSDLIKVDGGSEWKSPNGYPELQGAVPGAPKPKYKFTADKKLIEIKDEDPVKPEPPSGPPSPFKRMPSALPKKKSVVPPPVDKTGAHMNEMAKERAKNSKIEKPLESTPVHATASAVPGQVAGTNAHHRVHPQIQSLDEAPLREVRHHPTPKPVRKAPRPQNSHFFKEFFLPIIIIGGIGFLAWWGYKQFTSPAGADVAAAGLSIGDSATLSGSLQNGRETHSSGTDGPSAIPIQKSSESITRLTGQPKTVNKDSAAVATTADKGASAPSPAAVATPPVTAPKTQPQKPASSKDSSSDKNTAKVVQTKTPAPAEKKADTPAATTTREAPEKKAPVKTQKTAGIADYVSLSLNKAPEPGIKNVKIKVHNRSEDDLNIAVVEIKYYDKDGKFIQGETLQTGKINAGKTTTLKVPSSRNAERISYKVSLISGDNVYLMGR